MYYDEDFAMALKLQEQFDREVTSENHNSFCSSDNKQKKKSLNFLESGSLIDPSWEYVDPTPDIHVLFMQFDKRFFWNKLKHVEVRWSPRMTSCAGVCCYEGRGGLCSIRLSVPLLKLRPRKDLIETLLHEMIHAYLFVTHNDRDRDGHGPEFHKHMYRINKEAGTNISVYHNFHEEVKLYQQHWWRCDGPCQNRPPFFGMVKRSMNRAPGPSDFWYENHQRSCGGNFIKVREPENIGKKGVKKNISSQGHSSSQSNSKDIRNFFPVNGVGNSSTTKTVNSLKDLNFSKHTGMAGKSNVDTSKARGTWSPKKNNGNGSTPAGRDFTGGMLMNKGGGTLTITAKGNRNRLTEQSVSATKTGGRPLSNVKTIADVNHGPTSAIQNRNDLPNVNTINGPISNKTGGSSLSNVRTIIDVHHKPTSSISNRTDHPNVKTINGPLSKMPSRNFVPFGGAGHTLGTAEANKENPNRMLGGQHVLKKETVPGRGALLASSKPSKRAVAMDSNVMGCSANKRSAFVTDPNGEVFEIKNDISDAFPTVNCPVCNVQLKEYNLNSHLDICLSSSCEDSASSVDVVYIEDSPEKQECMVDNVSCPVCNLKTNKEDISIHLENCIGNVFVEESIDTTNQDSDDEIEFMDTTQTDQKFPCPSCSGLFEEKEMNGHLDQCLSGVF